MFLISKTCPQNSDGHGHNLPRDCLHLEMKTVLSSYSCPDRLSWLFSEEPACPFSCGKSDPNTCVSGVLLLLCALITVYLTSLPLPDLALVALPWPFLYGDLPRSGVVLPWLAIWGKSCSCLLGERPRHSVP